MQVHIPYYEDHDSPNYGGIFLNPAVWMGRLVVFIPQFNKQTIAATDHSEMSITNRAEKTSLELMPAECWKIKVGWTEYQNTEATYLWGCTTFRDEFNEKASSLSAIM